MGATTTRSTPSLIAKLRHDFPDIRLISGSTFSWSPQDRTVSYANETDQASLIHEIAHASLEHRDFRRDIELIRMERDAWNYAATVLANRYELVIGEEIVQSALDTYRDWLHSRSTCPECQATGLQSDYRLYTCLACTASWQVNEARACALRRTIVS